MRPYFLIALVVLMAGGCAAGALKYDACLGFCMSVDASKDETPEHVTKTITETVTQ